MSLSTKTKRLMFAFGCVLLAVGLLRWFIHSDNQTQPLPAYQRLIVAICLDGTGPASTYLARNSNLLMAASAHERAIKELRDMFKNVCPSDLNISCVDTEACAQLGIKQSVTHSVYKRMLTVTRLGDNGVPILTVNQVQQIQNPLVLVIPSVAAWQTSKPSNKALIKGKLIINTLPVRLYSGSTHQSDLISSDDLTGLIQKIVSPNSTTRVEYYVNNPRASFSLRYETLLRIDAHTSTAVLLKYGTVMSLVLALFLRIIWPSLLIQLMILMCFAWGTVWAGITIFFDSNTIANVPSGLDAFWLPVGAAVAVFALVFKRTAGESPFIMAALLACVILDMVTGGVIGQMSGLGSNPMAGARYYGLGNEISALGLAVLLMVPVRTLFIRMVITGLYALCMGVPFLGANGGDMLAMVVALIVTITISRQRRGVVWFATAIAGLLLITVIDARIIPLANRTHLGMLASELLDQKWFVIVDLVSRKAAVHTRLMMASAWGLATIVSGLLAVRHRFNGGKTELTLLDGACMVSMFLLNDSGPVSLALMMLVFVSKVTPRNTATMKLKTAA